jgi:hypothetical protein
MRGSLVGIVDIYNVVHQRILSLSYMPAYLPIYVIPLYRTEFQPLRSVVTGPWRSRIHVSSTVNARLQCDR